MRDLNGVLCFSYAILETYVCLLYLIYVTRDLKGALCVSYAILETFVTLFVSVMHF